MLDFKYNKQQQEAEELAKHYNMKFEPPTFRNAIQYNQIPGLSSQENISQMLLQVNFVNTYCVKCSLISKLRNYYASFNLLTDLTDWAEANGFDWENDLKRKKWYRTCLQQSNMERATEEPAGDSKENLPNM